MSKLNISDIKNVCVSKHIQNVMNNLQNRKRNSKKVANGCK